MASIQSTHEIEMDEDSSNNNGGVYIYNGVDEVPRDVTHVRVELYVTIIPARAFNNRHELEEVELPEGLVTIENYAFYHCKSLKRVNLPITSTPRPTRQSLFPGSSMPCKGQDFLSNVVL